MTAMSFDLPTAAADNLAAHASVATESLETARFRRGPDFFAVDSGFPCDTFNLVCRARLTEPAAGVGLALAFFAATGHPFSWWVSPGCLPEDLPRHLTAAGLVAAETEIAMMLDLPDLDVPPLPAGLDVRRVRQLSELTQFARLAAGNWSPPDPWVQRFYLDTATYLLRPEAHRRLYLGYLDGEAVATAELTVGGGVVGLYGIATLPHHRGRGIGTALTALPLADARREGHATAILQAAEAGVRLYRRLGFRPFGTIIEFKPPAPGTVPTA